MMDKENEEAIVVIQCAGKKRPCAGTFLSSNREKVRFVANPEAAPKDGACYAHPDDNAGDGQTWRRKLWHYNEQKKGSISRELLPAWKLYSNFVYEMLFESLGAERFFLLSPAWGLIRADFLIPNYDITFSNNAPKGNRWGINDEKVIKKIIKRTRRNDARFKDCSMLPNETTAPVLYMGGKDYQNLFDKLTRNIKAERFVFYNSKIVPKFPGCTPVRFKTRRRQNWQYECAEEFLAGNLEW